MLKLRNQFQRLGNHAKHRFVRSRRGSVLILVVLLLVLMAVLGTAYLVTAKNDMVASKLYEHNVQIDMLLQGVINQAKGAITDSSYQTVPLPPNLLQHYDDWFTTPTASGIAGTTYVDKTWMAARYPTLLTEAIGTLPTGGVPRFPCPIGAVVNVNGGTQLYRSLVDNNTSTIPAASNAQWQLISLPAGSVPGNVSCWPAISAPLAANAVFEDPRYTITGFSGVNVRPDGVRTCVTPTSVNVGGINYPALSYWNATTGAYETAMAASACGNGIADSFLWRLPIGTVDGITYYAAVRIIDDNSAINVNTANASYSDFDFTGMGDTRVANAGFLPGIFPSNIGLAEQTWSMRSSPIVPLGVGSSSTGLYAELGALNIYRTAGNPNFNATPIDDSGTAHNDFAYRNVGDALWHGLGRRITNPGYVTAGTLYQSLGWNESAQLAYKFDLINPIATPSIVEQCLVNSVYNQSATPGLGNNPTPGAPFRSSPWDASFTSTWFSGYAFTAVAGQTGNLRAYFVARNPTNNCMPVHQFLAGPTIVTPPAVPGTTGLTTAQMQSALLYMAGPDPLAGVNNKYNYATATAVPRVSLNTADVTSLDGSVIGAPSKQPTLWFGFYNAMMDAMNPSVNNATIVGGQAAALIANTAAGAQGGGQFRSPIRDVNGDWGNPAVQQYMNGPQMVLLRSFIAAVNAKDMRDSDDDVSCAVALNTMGFGTPFEATVGGNKVPVNVYVYGIEKQPYITEVYANNELQPSQTIGVTAQRTNPIYPTDAAVNPPQNPKGYVAVQLFNPYDVPIDMSNWTLGVLTRGGGGLSMAPITGFPGFVNGNNQSAIIQPHGYMLLENTTVDVKPAVASSSSNDATYRPWAVYTATDAASVAKPPYANTQTYYVPNLSEVMQDSLGLSGVMPGGELVLLRQLRANGAGAPTGNPALLANVANLVNFAPVDSFDFTGMSVAAPKSTVFRAIHYVRANPGSAPPNGTFPSATNLQTYWKFVYPGRWSGTGITYVVKSAGNVENPIGDFPARQEGIAVSSWDASGNSGAGFKVDWWTDLPGATSDALGPSNPVGPNAPWGRAYLQKICLNAGTGTPLGTTAGFPYASSYPNPFPAIQLNNTDMGGPAKQYAANAALPFTFPFGGFARIGDVLQVPYIGSYILINTNTGRLLEVNPVTRDAALADDQDSVTGVDDALEQVGRFCPLQAAVQPTGEAYPALPAGTPNGGAQYVSLVATGQTYGPGPDTYAWAGHILDYFTTLTNPNDDYFPNFDPNAYSQGSWNPLTTGAGPLQWQNPLARPLPVLNSGNGTPDGGNEDMATLDGLININTASAQTLYSVPWIPFTIGSINGNGITTGNALNLNRAIADEIIRYRSTYGPFKTLFDLNRVVAAILPSKSFNQFNSSSFNSFSGVYGNPATTNNDRFAGNLSPSFPYLATAYSTQDGVAGDFESRFNTLTRVSNIITTRSDTFTVYILVQGWSGTGTASPHIVVQRRVALIIDRSKVSAINRTLGITQVQTN